MNKKSLIFIVLLIFPLALICSQASNNAKKAEEPANAKVDSLVLKSQVMELYRKHWVLTRSRERYLAFIRSEIGLNKDGIIDRHLVSSLSAPHLCNSMNEYERKELEDAEEQKKSKEQTINWDRPRLNKAKSYYEKEIEYLSIYISAHRGDIKRLCKCEERENKYFMDHTDKLSAIQRIYPQGVHRAAAIEQEKQRYLGLSKRPFTIVYESFL